MYMENNQQLIITESNPVDISQTTENKDGQEIQTVILKLEDVSQIIEFD